MKLHFTLRSFFFFNRRKTPGSSLYQLTLKPPITTAADDNFDVSFYLPEKTSPDISCESSTAVNSHEMSRHIFSEDRKK